MFYLYMIVVFTVAKFNIEDHKKSKIVKSWHLFDEEPCRNNWNTDYFAKIIFTETIIAFNLNIKTV